MKNRKRQWCVYCIIIVSFFLTILWSSRAVTVISENMPVERRSCILIDPGHGGVDGGAISISGRAESIFNLEISLRLRDLLHFLGYDTRMTRSEDVSIYTKGDTIAQKKISDLKERVRIANSADNLILLSIHQNSFPDKRYSGAQIFYAKTNGSRDLAEKLQDSFVQQISSTQKRKAKPSNGVYLMEHIRCTGVLIECGFLSNPVEEAFLRSTAYQKKLCCIISGAVSQFLSNT